VRLLDSITEAVGTAAGCVVVSGSHGGLSAGRFAMQAQTFLAVFNDAGVGKDGAGIASLALMARAGMAACTVAHHSAHWRVRIHLGRRSHLPREPASP
jgi:hypothetical protein